MKISELVSKNFLNGNNAITQSYIILNYFDDASQAPVTYSVSLDVLGKALAQYTEALTLNNNTLYTVTNSGTTYTVTNQGALGDAAHVGVDSTFNASSSNLPTSAAIAAYVATQTAAAVNALDITQITNTADKTISTIDEVDGKVSATFQNIQIAESQVTNLTTHLDNKLETSLKGANSGLAELDANGKVPSSQLPSYVDDVIEGYLYDSNFYSDAQHTNEIAGESSKIYVDLTDGGQRQVYRWGGSAFVAIPIGLALGETSSTAYYGNKGADAYAHAVTNKGSEFYGGTVDNKIAGLFKFKTNDQGHVIAASAVEKTDITALGIPASDTTYSISTTATAGLMSAADKIKLDGIQLKVKGTYSEEQNYVYAAADSNGIITVPEVSTAQAGIVPRVPIQTGVYLSDHPLTVLYCGTGGHISWEELPTATTTQRGLMSTTDKVKLDSLNTSVNEMPAAPTTDGVYLLKATVSDSTATYTWVSANE